ncbi:D-2-hydroxyacid dehydrogenase [Priestia abyssalis]|uniref:D-2-hydroxyacid dehydrogenase n=1 Tax=Priestia abyssalis TaxID=1221450 RepID=UPI000994CE57|nr:D-2-hydroxyacid dehydrogenase [Priestia abyssalis]
MNIENILVTGHLYKEMEKILTQKNLSKNIRFVAEEEVSQEDVLWADVYVSFYPTEHFEFGNLKWVHSTGAGVDKYLYGREWDESVLLTRTVCSFGQRIGEYCLSYLLRDMQMHDTFAQMKAQRQWKPEEPKLLDSQRIVIYGTGEIGQEIARVLSTFRIKVSGVSRSGESVPFFDQVVKTENAAFLLKEADWVISTLPLTKQTYKIFNDAFFDQLNNSGFINVGRGATVDELALLEALQKKTVRQAVLDVFETEPLPETSPLWKHPDITITPHISAVTTPEEAVECFLDTLAKIENDEPLYNQVKTKQGY